MFQGNTSPEPSTHAIYGTTTLDLIPLLATATTTIDSHSGDILVQMVSRQRRQRTEPTSKHIRTLVWTRLGSTTTGCDLSKAL